MKKVVQLSESQFKTLIDKVINEDAPHAYVEHWENKFQKAVEVLLTHGYNINILISKIRRTNDELNPQTQSTINENFKIDGHDYNLLKLDNQTIYVGEDGILGDHHIFIPWNIIQKLLRKYKQ